MVVNSENLWILISNQIGKKINVSYWPYNVKVLMHMKIIANQPFFCEAN